MSHRGYKNAEYERYLFVRAIAYVASCMDAYPFGGMPRDYMIREEHARRFYARENRKDGEQPNRLYNNLNVHLPSVKGRHLQANDLDLIYKTTETQNDQLEAIVNRFKRAFASIRGVASSNTKVVEYIPDISGHLVAVHRFFLHYSPVMISCGYKVSINLQIDMVFTTDMSSLLATNPIVANTTLFMKQRITPIESLCDINNIHNVARTQTSKLFSYVSNDTESDTKQMFEFTTRLRPIVLDYNALNNFKEWTSLMFGRIVRMMRSGWIVKDAPFTLGDPSGSSIMFPNQQKAVNQYELMFMPGNVILPDGSVVQLVQYSFRPKVCKSVRFEEHDDESEEDSNEVSEEESSDNGGDDA